MNTQKLVEEIEVIERMLAALKHTVEMMPIHAMAKTEVDTVKEIIKRFLSGYAFTEYAAEFRELNPIAVRDAISQMADNGELVKSGDWWSKPVEIHYQIGQTKGVKVYGNPIEQPIRDIVRMLAIRQQQFTEQWMTQECMHYSHLGTQWHEVYAALLYWQSKGVIKWDDKLSAWSVVNPVPQPTSAMKEAKAV